MRDRLIDLLTDDLPKADNPLQFVSDEIVERLADMILENGVIVPPCKVGDKVYCIFRNCTTLEWYIEEKTVYAINIYTTGLSISVSPIISYIEMEMGIRLFLTKEEAEQALEKLKGGA